MSSVDPRTRPESDEPVLGYARVRRRAFDWRILRRIAIFLGCVAAVLVVISTYDHVTRAEFCARCAALRDSNRRELLGVGWASTPTLTATRLSRWIAAQNSSACSHDWIIGDEQHFWVRSCRRNLYTRIRAWEDYPDLGDALDRLQCADPGFHDRLVGAIGDRSGAMWKALWPTVFEALVENSKESAQGKGDDPH